MGNNPSSFDEDDVRRSNYDPRSNNHANSDGVSSGRNRHTFYGGSNRRGGGGGGGVEASGVGGRGRSATSSNSRSPSPFRIQAMARQSFAGVTNQFNSSNHSSGISHLLPSTISNGINPIRNFLKGTNGLGLSKTELDALCQPSGLYPTCPWEDSAIRRLIGDGRIAARLKGEEKRINQTDTECPICFLNYSAGNVTQCCHAFICTECYLQVRPQKLPKSVKTGKTISCPCPFCNASPLSVSPADTLSESDIKQRDQDEFAMYAARQRAIEQDTEEPNKLFTDVVAAREAVSQFQYDDSSSNFDEHGDTLHNQQVTSRSPTRVKSPMQLQQQSPEHQHLDQAPGFGSSLERDGRVATLRARSSSMAENKNNTDSHGRPITPDIPLFEMAMSPAERHAIEQEMRAQHMHPLTLRLEAEEAERRLQNEREYYSTRQQQQQEHSGSNYAIGSRDWNHIGNVLQSSPRGGTANSLDDMVVLEAAIMLSMQEESARTRNDRSGDSNRASFDVAQHARDGFALARERAIRNHDASLGSSAAYRSSRLMMMSDEEQLRLAIEASLQDNYKSSCTNNANDASVDNEETETTARGNALSRPSHVESVSSRTRDFLRPTTPDGVPLPPQVSMDLQQSSPHYIPERVHERQQQTFSQQRFSSGENTPQRRSSYNSLGGTSDSMTYQRLATNNQTHPGPSRYEDDHQSSDFKHFNPRPNSSQTSNMHVTDGNHQYHTSSVATTSTHSRQNSNDSVSDSNDTLPPRRASHRISVNTLPTFRQPSKPLTNDNSTRGIRTRHSLNDLDDMTTSNNLDNPLMVNFEWPVSAEQSTSVSYNGQGRTFTASKSSTSSNRIPPSSNSSRHSMKGRSGSDTRNYRSVSPATTTSADLLPTADTSATIVRRRRRSVNLGDGDERNENGGS